MTLAGSEVLASPALVELKAQLASDTQHNPGPSPLSQALRAPGKADCRESGHEAAWA